MILTRFVYSAEVRWFFAGPLPDELPPWFKPVSKSAWETRTDHYLLIPEGEYVCVKQRQGKLEIKTMLAPPEPISLGPHFRGMKARCAKWSRKNPALKAWLKTLQDEAEGWLPVQKKRIQHEIDLDREPPVNGRYPRGLMELTKIEALGDSWWSLCIEIHGPLDQVDPLLSRFEPWVAALGTPPREFDPADSYAYSGWLKRLIAATPGVHAPGE